jgi:hypothetical protein
MHDRAIRDILIRLALDTEFRAAVERDAALALVNYALPAEDIAAFQAKDHRMLALLARAQHAGAAPRRPTAAAVGSPDAPPERLSPLPPPPALRDLQFLVRCTPYPYWHDDRWQFTWGVSIHPAPVVETPDAPPQTPAPPPTPTPTDALCAAIHAAAPADRWAHVAALAAELGRV